MNFRLVLSTCFFLACLAIGLFCGGITATRAEPPVKRPNVKNIQADAPAAMDPAAPAAAAVPAAARAPAPDAQQAGELNRLSERERALLGSDKQTPQKTIAG